MPDYQKNDPLRDTPLVTHVKAEARSMREETPHLKQSHALEIASKLIGFKTYADLRKAAAETQSQ